jgi:3D (Asp-Asp-Asp) domain-containing protein
MGIFLLSTPQVGWAAGDGAAVAEPLPAYQVTLTGYNAVPSQTDGDPFTTASGAYSNPDIVAARSVDLSDELPFGTVIDIEAGTSTANSCGYDVVKSQIGLRVIADSMNPKMHNKVDILLQTGSAARTLGLCPGMQVTVIGHIDVNKMPKNQEQLAQLLVSNEVASAQ